MNLIPNLMVYELEFLPFLCDLYANMQFVMYLIENCTKIMLYKLSFLIIYVLH